MSLHAGSVVVDFRPDDKALSAAFIKAQQGIEKTLKTATVETTKSLDTLKRKALELDRALNKAPLGSANFKALSKELFAVNKEIEKAQSLSKGGSGLFSPSSMKDLARSLPIVGLGLAGIATGVAAIAKSALMAGAELQQMKIAFGTFLGSEGAAEEVVKQLNEFANVTPFTNDQALQAGKAWLAFGGEVEKLIPTLTAVGDVAAGTGKDFNQLAIIYSKAMTEGVIQNDTLNQLAEAGVPIIKEFAKQFGVAESSIRKMSEDGLIRFEHLEEAFKSMTGEGGQFFNLMEKQSKSFSGLLSTIEGQTQSFMAILGEGAAKGLTPLLEDIVNSQGDMAKNANDWAFQIEKAARTFSELVIMIKRAYEPVAAITKQLFAGAENVSVMNALMFGFVASVYAALAPFKLLITSLQYAQKSLSADFIMTQQQAAEMEQLRAEISQGLDKDFQMFENAWNRITEKAKKPAGINLEIQPQAKQKLEIDSGEAGKKAGKEAAFEWADSFQRAMKEKPIGFAGPAMSKIGDIGAAVGGKAPAGTQEKDFDTKIKEFGAKVNKYIEAFQSILQGVSKLLSAEFEKAMVGIQNQLQVLDFFGEVSLNQFRRMKEEEIAEFSRAEDEKIRRLREAQATQQEILDEQWEAQKEILDAELQAKLANLQQEYEAKLMYAEQEGADSEQRRVLQEILDEERKQKELEIIDEHNKEKDLKEADSNKRKEEEKKRSDEAIAKAEEEKNAKVAQMKKKADAEEKKRQKDLANMRWLVELHQFNLEKEFRKKQILLEAAQASMSAVQAAFSAGIFGLALLPGFLGLIASTTSASLSAVQSQLPPFPPAQNFASGGLVSGPGSATSDSIPANLSNGEFVMNATATARNLPALQSMNKGGSIGGHTFNFGTHSIMVIGNMDSRAAALIAQAVTQQQADILHKRVF